MKDLLQYLFLVFPEMAFYFFLETVEKLKLCRVQDFQKKFNLHLHGNLINFFAYIFMLAYKLVVLQQNSSG